MMKVKVLSQDDQSTLIEYQNKAGAPCRVYVPSDMVTGEIVSRETVDKGAPYGLPFEVELPTISPQQIVDELHKAGIWCYADLQAKDRSLIRIGTNLIGRAVWDAARKLEGNND